MLALYHLFSGTSHSQLPGIDDLMQEAGTLQLPEVKRVVLVGNRISPGSPAIKTDGTEVRTLWGELAWQLGYASGGASEARKAYERVRGDDEQATNPGDALRELMNDYGPCLILIDEWVAYARQLHEESDLPAGSFGTHFTFAQALSESAKLANNCLLVISPTGFRRRRRHRRRGGGRAARPAGHRQPEERDRTDRLIMASGQR